MVRDWKSIPKAIPLDWLPRRENPSVRYFTLQDILDYSQKDPEVEEAKSAIKCYEKVSKIIGKQKPEEYWESAEQPHHPKYKSTYWQIMILSQLGLDKTDGVLEKLVNTSSDFNMKKEDSPLLEKKEPKENISG